MAGAGYKLFNTGDVLTAAQVNTYLQEQTVMVFASSTARTTALTGVLAEGMMSYLQDTNSVEFYNGSSWVALASGDVTEVQAGTGISVASGTGPIPVVTNTMATAIDAKGDLVVGTGADTFSRLAVGGTNGHTLQVDSSTATGLKWAASAGTSFTTGYNYVTTSQTTTSTSFTDLATTQAVTVTTGTKALIILKAVISNAASYANTGGTLGVTVSGATTLSASDEHSVGMNVYNPSTNFQINMRGSILLTGLTAGSNTFTMKFKDTNGATSTFFNRSIAVIDLGS